VSKTGKYKVISTDKVTGCHKLDSVFVEVSSPDLSAYKNVCEGTQVVFDAHYKADSYDWDLGIAKSTQPNPVSTYKPGEYTIELKAVKGTCTTQVSQKMHVYPKTTADFTYTGQCEKLPVIFSAFEDTISGSETKYSWIFSDGYEDTSMTIARAFDVYGTYTATLKVTNPGGCSASISKTITIYAPPAADFSIKGNTLTAGSGGNYEWYDGNGLIAGEDSNVLIAKKSAYYQVSYENQYGCRGYSTWRYVNVITGLQDEKQHERISVWPNPGQDHFSIRWTNHRYDGFIITDLSGKVILSKQIKAGETETIIDMSSAKPGVYVLRANGTDGVTYTRLVKL
jgi:PKD repeat protein